MNEEGKQKVTGIRYIRITLLIFVLCNKAEQKHRKKHYLFSQIRGQ